MSRLRRLIFPEKYLAPWWDHLAVANKHASDIDPIIRQIAADSDRILTQNHLSVRVSAAFRRDDR